MFIKNIHLSVFVLFTLLLGLSCAQTDHYQQLTDHWFNKCFNQTRQNFAFDALYANGVEFKRYLKYAFKFIPEERNLFCERERPILDMKMRELAGNMKPCLAQQEKFFENFLYGSFKELLHFLCHNNGEYVNTFYSSKATECRNKLFNTDYPNLDNCFANLFKPSAGLLAKQNICSNLAAIKKCFGQALEYQCPSFGSYKKLNEDFFSYVSKPCSGCAIYLNSLLLTISLFVSYVFNKK